MTESKLHRYEGTALTVTYDVKRCIHAAACVRRLPQVFDPQSRPWVRPDRAPAEDVTEAVHACPTGALAIGSGGDASEEPLPVPNRGSIEADGPVYLHGRIRLTRPDGEVVCEDARVALCRCGASTNKPFCDGKHSEASFTDPGTAGSPRLDAESLGEGLLECKLAPDGPVIFDGPVEIRGADGEPLFRGQKAALCRCGASKNKPYCDGSHKGIGFQAP